MRIFIVRHGESAGNVDESAYEKYENFYIPLTKHGAFQAHESGKFLHTYLNEHPGEHGGQVTVWSGPYRRVVQTKNALLKELGDHVADSEQHYLLRETFHGIFDNIRDPKRQKELYPKEFEELQKQREKLGPVKARSPGGESLSDVMTRLKRFIDTYVGTDKDLVIVAHGSVANALEYHLCGRDEAWFQQNETPEGRMGNGDIKLLEGTREKGFTSQVIYRAPIRAADARSEMTEPYGGPFPERRAMEPTAHAL